MKYVMRESAQLGNIFLNKGEFIEATPFSLEEATGKLDLYKMIASGKTTFIYRWELDKYARPWYTPGDFYRVLSITVYHDAVPACVTVSTLR